jgi:hypothetical protein
VAAAEPGVRLIKTPPPTRVYGSQGLCTQAIGCQMKEDYALGPRVHGAPRKWGARRYEEIGIRVRVVIRQQSPVRRGSLGEAKTAGEIAVSSS